MAKKKNEKEDKKVGRPLKINDEELRKLETAFKMGCLNREACAYADIPESTFYDYIKAHPEFSEKMIKWKQNPILKAKHTIYQNLDNEKTAQWYLERKCKDEFSTKQEVEAVNTNIDIKDEKIINKVMEKLKEL